MNALNDYNTSTYLSRKILPKHQPVSFAKTPIPATPPENRKKKRGGARNEETCFNVIRRVQTTKFYSFEEQYNALKTFKKAQRDIDWILSVSRVTARHIQNLITHMDDDNFRFSQVFHNDKKPGLDTSATSQNQRKSTLRDKYRNLCQSYVDAHNTLRAACDDVYSSEAVLQNLIQAFDALHISREFREHLIRSILIHADDRQAPPDLRSQAIMLRYATAEAKAACALVEHSNQRLILAVARKLKRFAPDWDLDELLAEGQFGLRRAIEKYDPSLGHRFTTYAIWWIHQAIIRAVREYSSLIQIPVYLQERACSKKANPNEDSPHAIEIVSIHDHISDEDERTLEEVLMDTGQPNAEHVVSQQQTTHILQNALRRLSSREQYIVMHRFGFVDNPLDISELAAKLNLSKERIRQIEREALRKLAHVREVAELRPTT